jgi:hypothetical protein
MTRLIIIVTVVKYIKINYINKNTNGVNYYYFYLQWK